MRLPSPAKVNLFLAITERRPDGFHNLLSVAALLEWGDDLEAEPREQPGFELVCDHPDVPCDGTNLVLRAADAFEKRTGKLPFGVRFVLTKRIPVGAGLGGGSGNAVTALRLLNELTGGSLGMAELREIAAGLGSDCVLFLDRGPLIMRGRGEQVEALPDAAAARLRGRRALIFKPAFGIATAWAYGEMAARAPGIYLPPAEAEARLQAWLRSPDDGRCLLYNNMEVVAFEKYLALPALLGRIRSQFGLACGMSGSGSACFALVDDLTDTAPVKAWIREALGGHALLIESKIS